MSEFVGTAILLFVAVVVTRWVFGRGSTLAKAVPGLSARLVIVAAVTGLVLVLILLSPIGRSSGGHFNPAVSVVFWMLGALPGADLIAYVIAQMAGSVVGVGLGRMAVGAAVTQPGVNYAVVQPAPGWSPAASFVGEAVFLVVLMALVVMILNRPTLGHWTPVVICGVVGLLIVIGGNVAGAAFNPARQFGPFVLANQWSSAWPYLLGPIAGAVMLAGAIRLVGITQPAWCSLCGEPPRDLPAPGAVQAMA